MTFWRIVVVFWLSLFMVTLVVKYDDPRLLGGSDDANASPFVIAFRDAGVSGLPDLVNATVLVSIVSMCVTISTGTPLRLTQVVDAAPWLLYTQEAES
jgi:amino acid transporter